MAGPPALALVVRSTFFHVEVSDELLSEAEGASPRTAAAAGMARPGRDRRRSASCPPDCRLRARAAAVPVYVADTLSSVWRRPVTEGSPSSCCSLTSAGEDETLAAPPAWGPPECRMLRWPASRAPQHDRRRHSGASDTSTAASTSSASDDGAEPVMPMRSGMLPREMAAPPAWGPPECRMLRWPASRAPQHDRRRHSGASDTSTAASTSSASDDGAEPVMPMRSGMLPRKKVTTVPAHGLPLSSYASVCRSQSLPDSSHPCATATGFPPAAGSIEDLRTTVMMRNVPSNYTRDRLRELLDAEGFFGRYDFMYFPTDFRTASPLGFAFGNLASPADAACFRAHFGGFRQWVVRTSKVCNVSWASADQQGVEAN
eukprot:CAMPEP_0204247072 /NCGR_PEP_ID=MMETSP0361-20130328/98464_1 /ASSEMBLY_ACC=CAM_ASM_000343 /TAXON_ID=268821 /ORGANISM="Scrippsiella Hangoei, Strain SHTV-5" /LENGTH=372 /DNA_ID=CAMNT_0051220303 /DNA_START=55 /DNA_END=1170 /DNA_ORIENTATION=+